MDLHLTNHTALVTGSTAGIGLAIAKALAAEGAAVYINGRTADRVANAISTLKQQLGPKADLRPLAADGSTAAGCDAIVKVLPSVDILVNNLGIFEPKPFAEIPDADWERFFQTNVMSGVRLSRAYLPGMLQRNRGRILFISSESGVQIPAEMIHYGMTKSAQIAIARGMAELTAGTAVTVNSILPGPTRSEGVDEFVAKLSGGQPFEEFEKEFFRSVRPTSLIKRFATVDEVAAAVAFICSPIASAINGSALRVEGGVLKSAF